MQTAELSRIWSAGLGAVEPLAAASGAGGLGLSRRSRRSAGQEGVGPLGFDDGMLRG